MNTLNLFCRPGLMHRLISAIFLLFVSVLPARSTTYQLLPNVQYYVVGPSRDWFLNVLLHVSFSPPQIPSPPSPSRPFSGYTLYLIENGQAVFMDCASNVGADCGKRYDSTTHGYFTIAPDQVSTLGSILIEPFLSTDNLNLSLADLHLQFSVSLPDGYSIVAMKFVRP
jgi:hypothetical protein